MTDRIRTMTVVLDRDYRDDDASYILSAISMVKGVSTVTPDPPANMNDYIARDEARRTLRSAILALFDDPKEGT